MNGDGCICGAGVGQRHVPLCEAFAANVLNLDIAQEGDQPNPLWLRQFAETLKLEAELLKGHSEEMPTSKPMRAAVAILASIHMAQASELLTQLADDLQRPVASDHAVSFLPRVNSSLADTASPLPPLSHAGGGPGTGLEAAGGPPAAGRPDLPGEDA